MIGPRRDPPFWVLVVCLVVGFLPFAIGHALFAQVTTNPRITGEAGTVFTVGTGGATATTSGVLTTSTTQVCTIADTNLTTLWSYVLPANTLNVDGKGIRITAVVTTAANANLKSSALVWGAATTLGARSVAADNNFVVRFVAEVLRRSASVEATSGASWLGANAANSAIGAARFATAADSLASPVTIAVTGQNGTAAANDVCFQSAIVEVLR